MSTEWQELSYRSRFKVARKLLQETLRFMGTDDDQEMEELRVRIKRFLQRTEAKP